MNSIWHLAIAHIYISIPENKAHCFCDVKFEENKKLDSPLDKIFFSKQRRKVCSLRHETVRDRTQNTYKTRDDSCQKYQSYKPGWAKQAHTVMICFKWCFSIAAIIFLRIYLA